MVAVWLLTESRHVLKLLDREEGWWLRGQRTLAEKHSGYDTGIH